MAGKYCKEHSKACRSSLPYWSTLTGCGLDPDITVRRKVAFLLNALLIPSSTVSAASPAAHGFGSQTSMVVHPDSTVHNPESSAHVVHPNSHASMVADPTFSSTSDYAQRALSERGVPVPQVSWARWGQRRLDPERGHRC